MYRSSLCGESNNSSLPTTFRRLETSFRIWGQSLGDCSQKQTVSCTTEHSHENGEVCNFARLHLNRKLIVKKRDSGGIHCC